jgi:hypothetical protein
MPPVCKGWAGASHIPVVTMAIFLLAEHPSLSSLIGHPREMKSWTLITVNGTDNVKRR